MNTHSSGGNFLNSHEHQERYSWKDPDAPGRPLLLQSAGLGVPVAVIFLLAQRGRQLKPFCGLGLTSSTYSPTCVFTLSSKRLRAPPGYRWSPHYVDTPVIFWFFPLMSGYHLPHWLALQIQSSRADNSTWQCITLLIRKAVPLTLSSLVTDLCPKSVSCVYLYFILVLSLFTVRPYVCQGLKRTLKLFSC